jgi:negative regulator of sigma E activity
VTAGQFGEVDLDLLADYVGGALDGSPDEARVARLVATDPAWAEAHATLAPAVDVVRDALADWGAAPATMPPDVTERLTAALTAAAWAGTSLVRESTDRPALSAVPEDGDAVRGRRRFTVARRRWLRLAAPVAVAAAVAALAGFGVTRLIHDQGTKNATSTAVGGDSAGSSRGARGELSTGAAAPRALLEPAGAGVLASGTDYARATLPESVTALGQPATSTQKSSGAPHAASGPVPMMTDPRLHRLVDRAALATCLDAVAVAHGQGPVAVNVVDYASFEGKPALVITFADPSGARWAWVTGPGCGLPGSGADTLYNARLG